MLEKWGEEGALYRFECRVAIATNADYSRHFEATAEQPISAMNNVLGQVETWRAGGQAQ